MLRRGGVDSLRRALANAAAALGSQAVTWIATFAFMAGLGRYLGDAGLGILFLGYSFTGLFAVLANFGLAPYVTREVARAPASTRDLLWNALAVTAALWLLSFGLIQVVIWLLGYPPETAQVLRIFAGTMGLQAATAVLTGIFSGLGQLGHTSLGTSIEKVFVALAGLTALAFGAGVVQVAWVVLAGAALGLLWQLGALLRQVRARPRLDLRLSRRLLLGGAPFVLQIMLAKVYWHIDAVMLSRMADEAVVGWYGAAYRLYETLGFLPNIVAVMIMMPILSRLSVVSHDAMRTAFEKGLTVLLVLGIPIAVGMIVLAEPILLFIYERPEFAAATPILQLLGLGTLVLYVNMAVGWALVSLERERKMALVSGSAVLLNVSLNLLMIPAWQHVGAAAATVITEVFIGAGYLLLLPRWLLPRASLAVAARSALAAAVMAAAILASAGLLDGASIVAGEVRVPLLVLVGVVAYALAAVALRAVPPDDLRALRQAVARRGPRAGRGPLELESAA